VILSGGAGTRCPIARKVVPGTMLRDKVKPGHHRPSAGERLARQNRHGKKGVKRGRYPFCLKRVASPFSAKRVASPFSALFLDDLRDRIWSHYEIVLQQKLRDERITRHNAAISDPPF